MRDKDGRCANWSLQWLTAGVDDKNLCWWRSEQIFSGLLLQHAITCTLCCHQPWQNQIRRTPAPAAQMMTIYQQNEWRWTCKPPLCGSSAACASIRLRKVFNCRRGDWHWCIDALSWWMSNAVNYMATASLASQYWSVPAMSPQS